MITAINVALSLVALWLVRAQHRRTVERLQKEIEHLEWVCTTRDQEIETLLTRIQELHDQPHKNANIGAW